jgi:cytochrome c biogenesis protein CcmG/thiol:disulfide interchange protein DsbE
VSRAGLLLAAALAAAGCGEVERPAGEAPAPEQAQPFELTALDGGQVALSALRGRPVLVDFWATWCAPCVEQIPVLNAIHDRHGDGVAVLGVSVDTEGRDVVAAFAAEHDIRYRVLLGSPELARRWGAIGFPTLFVVAPDGSIASAHVGVATEEELEEALAQLAAP